MDNMSKPNIIKLSKIGSSVLGYITVAEENLNIPFNIKRVYWTYFTPQDVHRGGHAHKELEQMIFAVSGTIEFTTEDIYGNTETFILDSPEKGLYIPSKIWRDIKFSHNAVLLCLASEFYIEEDYIRDYDEFKKLMK
ncbi:MAG: WxcM-like domain-containing protein [Apibacter sp.]|jgi:dTDP-4-dehydrorhamnose 3,5-epimerase-like enzyme|nr:WxcM-like domain-containing protein [Apibacter sp.]